VFMDEHYGTHGMPHPPYIEGGEPLK